MRLILTIVFTYWLGSGFAQNTWYVSPSGSDSNSGTSAASAFATITHAFGAGTCGDSVYVIGGTYHEKINAYALCPENNRFVVQGDTASRPTIIGDSTQFNKYALGVVGSGYVFRHFELTSPYPDSCTQSNMVIVGSGDHFDFIDLIVHHAGYDGIKTTLDCAINDFAEDWRIIDSQVLDNGLGCPSSVVNGDGIDFTGCQDCLIRNTVIRDNMGHQLQVKLQAANVTVEGCHIEGRNMLQVGLPGNFAQCDTNAFNADGVTIRHNVLFAKGDTNEFVLKLADVNDLLFENNTVIKDSVNVNVGFICFGSCGSAPNWQFAPQSTIVRNNIFYNAASLPFYGGAGYAFYDPFSTVGGSVDFGHNCFYDVHGEFGSPPDSSLNSFVADPLFCDYPMSYELSQGSPCIDAGDPGSPLDPDQSLNDMGAFYYQTNCVVGIDDQPIRSTQMTLYPNPASEQVLIVLPEDLQHAEMRIFDVRGKLVLSAYATDRKTELDLTDLKTGLYLILAFNKDTEVLRSSRLLKY